MALSTTSWAWRKGSKVVHLGVRGRGIHEGQIATYCNKYWVRDHVLPVWDIKGDPPTDRRPCLLCIGWLARNGASWEVLMSWMKAQGRVVYPDTPKPRHLTQVA